MFNLFYITKIVILRLNISSSDKNNCLLETLMLSINRIYFYSNRSASYLDSYLFYRHISYE